MNQREINQNEDQDSNKQTTAKTHRHTHTLQQSHFKFPISHYTCLKMDEWKLACYNVYLFHSTSNRTVWTTYPSSMKQNQN